MPKLVPLISFLISASYIIIVFLGIDCAHAYGFYLKRLVVPKLLMLHEGSGDYHLPEDSKKNSSFRNKVEFTGQSDRRSAFSCVIVAFLGYSQEAAKPSLAASNNDCLEECLRECYGILPNPSVSIFKSFAVGALCFSICFGSVIDDLLLNFYLLNI